MEVASAFVSLMPSAKGFGSKLDREVGGETRSAGKRLGSGFGRAFAAGGAVIAAAGVGSFFKGAISGASDLSESQSKVGVVFGKAAGQINQAAKTSATSMGLSKNAYLSATGSLGNLLVSLDLAPKKAANMSQEMVKLAGDLASFNNVSPEEALAALQSGLTGETEPLKKFGVNMNDATLKAQALKMGLIKTTKEALTPQAKALAAQALIMKQTKTAQGDFARTSGGLANQQRILAARFENTKAAVGKVLLPIVTRFVTFLNTGLGPAMAKVGEAIRAGFSGDTSSFSGLLGFVAKVGDVVGALVYDVFPRVKSAVTGAFSSFSGGGAGAGLLTTIRGVATSIATNFLPVLRTMGTTFTTTVLPALQRLGAYLLANLVPIFTKVGTIISTQVVPVIATLARFFYGTLYPAVVKIVTSIAGSLKPVFDALFQQIQTTVLPIVTKLLAKFKEWWPTISKVVMIVLKVVVAVLRLAAAILGKVLPPLIRFAGFLIRVVVGAVIAVVGVLVKIISHFIKTGQQIGAAIAWFGRFSAAVDKAIRAALQFIGSLPGKIKGVFAKAGTFLLKIGGQIVDGLVNGIKGAYHKVLDAAKGLIDKIPGPIRKAMGIASPSKVMHKIGGHIGQGLINGIKAKEKGLRAQIASTISKLNAIGEASKGISDTVAGLFRGDMFTGGLEELRKSLYADLFNAQDFTKAIRLAASKGLNGGLYRAVAESGNVKVAQELAALSRADIQKYENLFNARENAAKAAGGTVATELYGKAWASQQAELRGLRADLRQVLSQKRQIIVNDRSRDPKRTAREVVRREAFAGGA